MSGPETAFVIVVFCIMAWVVVPDLLTLLFFVMLFPFYVVWELVSALGARIRGKQ